MNYNCPICLETRLVNKAIQEDLPMLRKEVEKHKNMTGDFQRLQLEVWKEYLGYNLFDPRILSAVKTTSSV